MKITVRDQILTGNIGDGWADTYAAAKGWAKYYGAKLTEFINNEYPDAEIEIDIEVERATGYYSRGMSVEVVDSDNDYGVTNRLADILPRWADVWWDDWRRR